VPAVGAPGSIRGGFGAAPVFLFPTCSPTGRRSRAGSKRSGRF